MISKQLRYAEMSLRYPTVAVCLYEVVAVLSSGRMPTVTDLAARHRWMIPIATGLVAWHLIVTPPPR